MVRTYETMVIVHPETTGDAYAGVQDKFKGILEEKGATILKVDDWGPKTLAYPIKKQPRGNYFLLIFEAEKEAVFEMERRLRIDDTIMRYQTVLHQETAPAKAAEPAAEEAPAAPKEETPAAAEEE